jgi:hypothetical protein
LNGFSGMIDHWYTIHFGNDSVHFDWFFFFLCTLNVYKLRSHLSNYKSKKIPTLAYCIMDSLQLILRHHGHIFFL